MTVRPQPYTAFNFLVKLFVPENNRELCDAGFSECSGLEMNHEPKSIREGGNNTQAIHLVGPISYGQLSLKRGMTKDFDLWTWFEQVQTQKSLRANAEVQILASGGQPGSGDSEKKKNVVFKLTGCLPIKLKAPTLNASDGTLAIEEMQIAYETMTLDQEAK